MKRTTSIVIGILLIIYGVICLLNALGFAFVDITFDGWWTLFIIIPCINGIITSREKLKYSVGLVFGVLLLLAAQNIISYDLILKMIIPILAIALGIKFIFSPEKPQ